MMVLEALINDNIDFTVVSANVRDTHITAKCMIMKAY